jgi:hypothetical protein
VTRRFDETSVKPVPVIDAALTVTGELPVEVRMRDNVAGELIVIFPKLSWVRLRDKCGFDAAMPVPLRATVVELPPEASLRRMS